MALPLFSSRGTHRGIPLVRVSRDGALAVADRQSFEPEAASRCGVDVHGRVPDRLPNAGEQFRFHIDMSRCIGCKCCVVACNEQNGNPASIQWRRVGEVEGGSFPVTRRAYFSMGCNHCADPTCLAGCPVDAYSKDEATGLVRHSAETCIGCQYCTWTCSYGVPQFNPERGVVGKCDMCYGRLSRGQSPACVSACPEGALAIEIVNVADWRASVAAAEAGTGRPSSDASVSTTRVTLPPLLPPAAQPVDLDRLEPAEPHLPLVVMTVLTQLSAGAFAAIWIAQLFGVSARLGAAAAGALGVGGLALAVAALHLGRPIHAYRAMRMWRRSWLSREAVLFFAFVHAAAFFTAALWFGWPGAAFLGGATTVLGLAGVVATGCIYLVPSRPAWNTPRTIVHFLLTAALLGTLTAAAAGVGNAAWFRAVGAATAIGLAASIAYSHRIMAAAASVELRGTARLLSTTLVRPFAVRFALLAAGGVLMPLASRSPVVLGIALALALSGELVGRYLFFVSAVPRHMTASYLPAADEAA
jgi:formate dehydrogenase iron-sulfur subunit